MNELRGLLDVIKLQESSDPQIPDPAEVLILRGLFYVHLYAVFAFSVNQAVQRFLGSIYALNVSNFHLEPILHSVTLDAEFSSLRNIGDRKTWGKRVELLRRQLSSDHCAGSDTVFGTYLQNVWLDSLKQVFECFCISDPVVPDERYGLFIDEIVNKRNSVAHGRESPSEVGRGTRSPDLQIRFDALATVIEHVFFCFQKAISERTFIASQHRQQYLEMGSA